MVDQILNEHKFIQLDSDDAFVSCICAIWTVPKLPKEASMIIMHACVFRIEHACTCTGHIWLPPTRDGEKLMDQLDEVWKKTRW